MLDFSGQMLEKEILHLSMLTLESAPIPDIRTEVYFAPGYLFYLERDPGRKV